MECSLCFDACFEANLCYPKWACWSLTHTHQFVQNTYPRVENTLITQIIYLLIISPCSLLSQTSFLLKIPGLFKLQTHTYSVERYKIINYIPGVPASTFHVWCVHMFLWIYLTVILRHKFVIFRCFKVTFYLISVWNLKRKEEGINQNSGWEPGENLILCAFTKKNEICYSKGEISPLGRRNKLNFDSWSRIHIFVKYIKEGLFRIFFFFWWTCNSNRTPYAELNWWDHFYSWPSWQYTLCLSSFTGCSF